MMDILSTEEMIKHANFEIPKGMKKFHFYFFAFTIDILIRYIKRLFEIVLHVEW